MTGLPAIATRFHNMTVAGAAALLILAAIPGDAVSALLFGIFV